MPTIVHFEIPADDVNRARDFYAKLFGWTFEESKSMEYLLITTSGQNPVSGGMMKRQMPGQVMTNYVDVPSVDDHASQVLELGGKVIVPKTRVPGYGYFAVCLDTENNAFGLWTPDMNAA